MIRLQKRAIPVFVGLTKLEACREALNNFKTLTLQNLYFYETFEYIGLDLN